jgi:hypothetical protein
MARNESDRWLIYRSDTGDSLAAAIVDRDDDRYWVEVDGDIVGVNRVKGRQREARAGSLDLLSVVDPDALTTRFEQDPVAFVVDVLADHSPRDLSKEEVVAYTSRLKLELNPDTWKQLQPALKKHPHVEVLSGRPVRYR